MTDREAGELIPTRSGETSLRIKGKYLHSRRDPATEAQRFLASQTGQRTPATVLLVAPGLGYLSREVRRRFPSARIITLHLSTFARNHAVFSPGEVWDPSRSEPVDRFLSRLLREEDLPGLLPLFWRPGLAAFPDVAESVQEAVHTILSRLNANLATLGTFGPRWFRNALANYLRSDHWAVIEPGHKPIVVVAPGPSLEAILPTLRRTRQSLVILAPASALRPLMHQDMLPDLVIHQDAGFFSGEHLRHLAGDPVAARVPLLQAQSARPLPALPFPRSWILYDHPAQVLFARTGSPAVAPGQELGTVTATASAWALARSRAPVYLAGVDLATRDIQSHVRGHAFDSYHRSRESRLAPAETVPLSRIAGTPSVSPSPEKAGTGGSTSWRSAADLSVYAGWFRSLTADGRLRRLLPSPVDLGLPEASLRELESYPKTGTTGLHRPVPVPDRRDRRDAAVRQLRSWQSAVLSASDELADHADAAAGLPSLLRHLALSEVLQAERADAASPDRTRYRRAARERALEILDGHLRCLDHPGMEDS